MIDQRCVLWKKKVLHNYDKNLHHSHFQWFFGKCCTPALTALLSIVVVLLIVVSIVVVMPAVAVMHCRHRWVIKTG